MSTVRSIPQGLDLPVDVLLTIGELASHTGLTPELLRVWEARHRFPEPTRLPSGHRRYTGADVRAVRRVVEERDRGMRLDHAIAVVRSAGHVAESGSVYASLSARHPGLPSYALTKRTLRALSWAIEDECLARAGRAAVVGTFQRRHYFQQSIGRWSEIARTARAAVVMADFVHHDDTAAPARVALPADSPLLREWIVACDGPDLAATLVAWELPGQVDVPDAERHFESVWSVDSSVVRDAAVLACEVGAALGSGAARDMLWRLEDAPPTRAEASQAATSVVNRMVAYTDGTVLRGREVR